MSSEEVGVMWGNKVLVPTLEEAATFIPSRLIDPSQFDYELARSHGLIGESDSLTKDYLTAQAIYKAAFYQYLKKMIDLSKYEKKLDETGYIFVSMPYDHQHFYQRYGSFGNRFIFFRNNFFIERLHSNDLKILIETSDEDVLVGLVGRTFKDVIRVNPSSNTDKYSYIYDTGVFSGSTEILNTALLIYMAFDLELDEAGELISIENEKVKEKLADKLAIQMQEELTKILEHPVVVRVWNW